MNDRAISVAMATYNGERFLQEQLDSLARQTMQPCELVVCDDGSKDGTLDILHMFARKAPFPVHVHQNETRLGFGFNFLGALARCRGELVAFCDQDDIWREEKLDVCARAMSNPEVALVCHSAVDYSSQPVSRRGKSRKESARLIGRWKDFPGDARTPGFSMVFRRDLQEKVPLPAFDANHTRWASHDCWVLVAGLSCGSLLLLPDELVLHRLHETNATVRAPVAGPGRVAPDPYGLASIADRLEATARFLQYAAGFCDEPAQKTFRDYIAYCERRCSVYRHRARLHQTCGQRLKAIRTLAGMVANGDYSTGDFGAKAFLRDAFLAALRPARNSA